MENKYFITVLALLTLLTYIMFCRDAMKEYFIDGKVGKCMNLYSKSKLKTSGINVIASPGQRSEITCPPAICQYSDSLKKCIPVQKHANNKNIQNYCSSEEYIEEISNKKLCEQIGYVWDNGKCNPTIKRKEAECPSTLCDWDNEKNSCNPKTDSTSYSVEDYDSVNDYCQHLKGLSPDVQSMTCQNAGERYNYNDLVKKCINVDINPSNINDECWGTKTQNDCLDNKSDCVWLPSLPSVSTASDIKGLRSTELETIDKEATLLHREINKYLDTVKPYQDKMDKEQAAKLIIDIVDRDDKDRYKFDKNTKIYQLKYETSL